MKTEIIIMGATGRMGSIIARMAGEDIDISIVGVVERADKIEQAKMYNCLVSVNVSEILEKYKNAVVIDFTSPAVSLSVAKEVAKYGALHVIGTTGFTEVEKKELEELAKTTAIFWSPNMSIGVNALLQVLPMLTKILGEEYDMEMMEIHHNKKKDSPSGTALRIVECLAQARNWSLPETACYHREGIIGERPKKEIGVQTLRGGDVVGVHTVYYMGAGERIEITHQAHSRENFASGALRAAKWLKGQKTGKLYSMLDILQCV